MKALILTYDHHAPITELVMRTYEEYWPEHPFEWLIPYQDFSKMRQIASNNRRKIRFIPTAGPIRSTMQSLLEHTGHEEWVWWCMVDKFLKYVDASYLSHICHRLDRIPPAVVGILTCQVDSPSEQPFAHNIKHRIYMPQFLRAKILKKLFLGDEVGFREGEKMLDLEERLGRSGQSIKGSRYITKRNGLLAGETTIAGKLTEDCVRAFILHGMEVPTHIETTSASLPIGSFPLKYVKRLNGLLSDWNDRADKAVKLTGSGAIIKEKTKATASISAVVCCKGWFSATHESIAYLGTIFNRQIRPHVDEIILVDYDCPQGVSKWFLTDGNPLIKLVRVPKTDVWHMNHARNCGAKFATKERLLFLDLGYRLTMVTTGQIRSLPDHCFLMTDDSLRKKQHIAMAMHHRDFRTVGGFEEGVTGRGYHDDSMIESLIALGSKRLAWEEYKKHEVRNTVSFWPPSSEATVEENRAICEILRQRHPYKNNIGRNWGLGGHLEEYDFQKA